MKGFRALSVATAVATYALVVLGGVVRVSGSGLGCPDWPLCHGRVLPPLDLHAIIEYSHRTAASLTSTLVVLTAAVAWMAWRNRRDLVVPATLAVSLLAVQVVLGAITVRLELPPMIVLAHLATAMALLGAVCVTAVASLMPMPAQPADAQSARRARGAAGGTYLLILTGSLVVGSGASGACDAWPLCGGGFRLAVEGSPAIQLLHRGVAAVIGLLVVMSLLSVLARHRRQPAVRATVALTLAALAFQVAVGAAVVTLHLPAVLRGLHLALASAVWSGTVILAVIASRLPPAEQPLEIRDASRSAGRPVRDVVLDYVSLAKPRIIPLLLITALGGMMMAERGWPSTGLVLLTLLGGALAAAGAGAINCWIDRDLDREMLRTRRRPLPDGRIAPSHALIFGIGLGLAAFLVLAFWVNVLAATLAISGLLFYVFVYTLWLKRWTVQNIVIGGAAGAVPPMVGWAAVTHRLDLTALYLFAIIFLWTPPHFWALALRLKGDYARARVPMLPVVRGESAARRQILFYTLILVAVTLAVVLTGALGLLYLAGAGVLGGLFIALAVANLRTRRQRWSRLLFDYSIAYLGLLFAVMVADRMIGRL
ncbi:MAG: protoheme IX farnesyltransferase [Chloroflexi bacterium]|nr:MAG: protoheme IX farnesyltransferase [Chloroflexota bacterium]TMG47225.1 MAG: protoheme IX farnesyltransferase [Chloroflexota bacterium]